MHHAAAPHRTTPHHTTPHSTGSKVALSLEEEADYRRGFATRRPTQSQKTPELWLHRLQRAMYNGAQSDDRVP